MRLQAIKRARGLRSTPTVHEDRCVPHILRKHTERESLPTLGRVCTHESEVIRGKKGRKEGKSVWMVWM